MQDATITLPNEEERIPIPTLLRSIGTTSKPLAMRELKHLSALLSSERSGFWPLWRAISAPRRAEIAKATVEITEDNIELDFAELWYWLLEDDDVTVRTSAIDGLWEDNSTRVMRQLSAMLRNDPAESVRVAAALALSRFAYTAALGELDDERQAEALQATLFAAVTDRNETPDVRRRSLESAGYFADDEVQDQIKRAYESGDKHQRESALVAMGRSMLPRWLPLVSRELASSQPALRYEAARAAGEMAEEARELLPKLMPLVNGEDAEVALAGIWAMGQIGGAAAKRVLQQIQKNSDEARSQAAADALEEVSLGESMV